MWAKTVSERQADGTRAQVFAKILTAGPLSRTDLARELSLSQSTVTKIVNPLLAAGYLLEIGERSSSNGRPQRLVQVANDRHHAIGIKLAPAHATAVITDLEATVLSRRRLKMPAGYPPDYGFDVASTLVDELLDATPGARDRVLGIGVGIGGHIDSATGRCVRSGIMGWNDVDIADTLSAATGLPIVVNNDVNALVTAERWFGSGRDSDHFAVVTVGAGVGCGLVLGGDLYTGSGGLAGEFGHTPLVPDGPYCSCGNRGCLETVASDIAVLRDLLNTDLKVETIEDAIAHARNGEPAAVQAFHAMGDALGRGLAVLCNLLNLEKIIITGERAGAYDLFGPACQNAFTTHGFSTAARDCEIIVDQADDNMWARGAACLIISHAVYSPS